MEQEIDHLFERRVSDEIVHVVPAIQQAALVAIDEADLRGGDDDVLETGFERLDLGGRRAVGHDRPALLPVGGNENAILYHTAECTSRLLIARCSIVGVHLVALHLVPMIDPTSGVLDFYD